MAAKKILVINGSNFSDLEGFYNEVDRVLTKNLAWQTGHNLDAFNDLLRGGFGVTDYNQPYKLVWQHARKSKKDLGEKLFNILLEIITGAEHHYIEFVLEE